MGEGLKVLDPISSKYTTGGRIPIFGHAAHEPFKTNSQDYVPVPGTFASGDGALQKYTVRFEVMFAVNWDCSIGLRMRDPANNITAWEITLKGGHASNDWWSFVTTPAALITRDPWSRQYCLEMKTDDQRGAILGQVVLWIIEA